VEPSGIVDAVDELGKIFDDIGECLERHWIDALDLQRLHEAFCLGVVVRISSPTHGPFDAVIGEVVAVDLGSILGSSIGMMDATGWRLSSLDRDGKGSERQSRVARVPTPEKLDLFDGDVKIIAGMDDEKQWLV
jgi:hypothetical protein